jgi:hypothetical protein
VSSNDTVIQEKEEVFMQKNQSTMFLCLIVSIAAAACARASQADRNTVQQASEPLEKQPVFLFCPHNESLSSWSLFVLVDKNDPTKAVALGLEELSGKNSKDLTYRGVLNAQKDPSTQRNELGRLDAKDFGTRKLEGKDNLLAISVEETENGLKLTVDARIGREERFVVGGPARAHRDLVLKYSSVYKCWQAKSTTLEDNSGHNAVGRFAMTVTGIVFCAGVTGISRIAAVDEFGSAVMLMDK